MARVYGSINVAIWEDAEFCNLSAGAQRTWFMLYTQPDIAACGTLALTVRRWQRTVRPDEREQFPGWLAELAAGETPFILIDEDTEELLVRSFVKWDLGYRNPKRLMAIKATANVIRSARLRQSMALSLAKLGIGDCPSIPNGTPIDSPSIGDRTPKGLVTLVGKEPGPRIQEPEPGGDDPSLREPPTNPEFCDEHQPDGTDEPCGRCAHRRKRALSDREQRKRAEAERRRQARQRVLDCPDCNAAGFTENDGNLGPRCKHPNLPPTRSLGETA